MVNRPIAEVWAFVSDPFNILRVRGSRALSLRQTSPGPPGVGTTFQMRARFFGLEWRLRGVVTDWDPPQAYAWSVSGAGLRSLSLRVTLAAAPDGTKVATAIELEPRPAFTVPWWIAWRFIRHRAGATDQDIKRLLEAGRG